MSISVSSAVVGGLIGTVLGLIPIMKEYGEQNWKKQFRRQLTEGIANGNLKYPDIQHIAERWSQDRKAVLLSLRVLLSQAVSGDEDKLREHSDALRQLLHEHEQAEPFAELPENVSLQLSALSSAEGNISTQAAQLANSLSELYASHHKKLRIQTMLAVWSVVFGIAGIIVGIVL